MSQRLCEVADCGRKHYANGYCEAHDRRIARGRALGPIRPKAAPGAYGPACALITCGRRHYAKGFCRSHYNSHLWSRLAPEQREARALRAREYAQVNRVLTRIAGNKSDARRKGAPGLDCSAAQSRRADGVLGKPVLDLRGTVRGDRPHEADSQGWVAHRRQPAAHLPHLQQPEVGSLAPDPGATRGDSRASPVEPR